jgi:hypothetical protein
MAVITIPGMFLTGNHAGRPSSDVGTGTLYACSTHALIYQTTDDGSTWVTWATLGTSGSVATDAIWDAAGDLAVGSGANTAARLAIGANATVLTSNGTTATWASPTGGGAATAPDVQGFVYQGVTNGTSHAITIPAQASGGRIVVVTSSYGRDVDSVACSNVTFTEVLTATFGSSAYLTAHVGVVSGGSSGTTITVTCTGSNFIIADCYLIADTLTPTAGASATLTNTSALAVAGTAIGPVASSPGDFFIIAAATSDATTGLLDMYANAAILQCPKGAANAALVSAIGRASGDSVIGYYQGGGSGADIACGVVIVS